MGYRLREETTMDNNRDDYPQWTDDEEYEPMPRWMAAVYVLLTVGGIAAAYMGYQWWLA